ncbi:hypothetical protein PYCCODRAFT_1307557 [Trametes coccinea BRFM310]|uniref:Uncharacterized protein n=1 Tax=Trametes coccinea (strain BRFM310) TaxID=1353009 RepID=A0A1Y2I5S5_TRAC3|nr:hypothetical protein PYCCODRAFT_1307557 [Trametes coccinea BRFM310]
MLPVPPSLHHPALPSDSLVHVRICTALRDSAGSGALKAAGLSRVVASTPSKWASTQARIRLELRSHHNHAHRSGRISSAFHPLEARMRTTMRAHACSSSTRMKPDGAGAEQTHCFFTSFCFCVIAWSALCKSALCFFGAPPMALVNCPAHQCGLACLLLGASLV